MYILARHWYKGKISYCNFFISKSTVVASLPNPFLPSYLNASSLLVFIVSVKVLEMCILIFFIQILLTLLLIFRFILHLAWFCLCCLALKEKKNVLAKDLFRKEIMKGGCLVIIILLILFIMKNCLCIFVNIECLILKSLCFIQSACLFPFDNSGTVEVWL